MLVKSAVALVLSSLTLLVGCQVAPPLIVAHARASSQNVPVNQVEDAAFWIDSAKPANSLLLIANKTRGMEVHDVSGLLLKHYEDGIELAGVDVLYGFPLPEGNADLAIAAAPGLEKRGVRAWRIDAAKRRLRDMTDQQLLPVLDDQQPLGLVAYHSPKTGAAFFFVTTEEGAIEQYELRLSEKKLITAKRVRQFSLPGKVKAGVADDENGIVYFALEKKGIYKFAAEPDASIDGTCVIRLGENGLTPDLAGITLYKAGGNQGYLIVVNQNEKGTPSTLSLYERQPPYAFVAKIVPTSENGGIYGASGIAVTSQPTTAAFPAGILAVKNRINPNASEDYKIYSWQDIARAGNLAHTHAGR